MAKIIAAAAALSVGFVAMTMPASVQAQALAETDSELGERKALATQIVDIAYPVENREAMFIRAVDQMEAQMLQALSGQIDDEGALAIIRKFQKEARAEQEELLGAHIPMLMDAWAAAYADLFTKAELVDILTFVQTDTGRVFLERSAEIISNPHFVRANQAYMDAAMAKTMDLMPKFMEELAAYKAAQHAE